MMASSSLTAVGLLLDIIGVMLVYYFGIPEKPNRNGHSLIVSESDPREKQKAETYDRLGKAGLRLLIIGFLLQLVGAQIVLDFFTKLLLCIFS